MPRTEKHKFKRLFLAADLHGSEIVFRKFLAAAKFYEADALLIGGGKNAQKDGPGGGGGGGGVSNTGPGEERGEFLAGGGKKAQENKPKMGANTCRFSGG